MITHLTGRIHAKAPDSCVIEVADVGYEVAMSTTSLAALPAEGDTATVLTFLQVRDDGLSLYGFGTQEEKDLFEMLISVSGVGPKVALAALSALSPDALRHAVAREDDALIAETPGIGKKTAQRIIVELKDRLDAPDLAAMPAGARDAYAEARDALVGMGFTRAEVAEAVADLGSGKTPPETGEIVRHALKRLGGAR